MSVVTGAPDALEKQEYTCDSIEDAMSTLTEVVGGYDPEAQKLTKAEILWLEKVGKYLLTIFLPFLL